MGKKDVPVDQRLPEMAISTVQLKETMYRPKRRPRILFVGWFDYPYGSAGASRIRHMARGLTEAGAKVRILTTKKLTSHPEELLATGVGKHSGVFYETTAGTHDDSVQKGRFRRASALINSIRRSWHRCEALIRCGAVDTVILYSRSFLQCQPIIRICRKHRVPVLVDAVEWYITRQFPFLPALDWFLGMNGSYRRLDGAIGISGFIQEKFHHLGVPAIRVPALLDVPQNQYGNGHEPGTDLVYVGQCKDDEAVEDLVEGLRIARSAGCAATLTIVGNVATTGRGGNIRSQISGLPELNGAIRFTGRLPDDAFAKCLNTARALVLLRKQSIRARAAFPTRIPEFLQTGNPVITTTVPDIPEYLQDGVHAHVVPPGRPDLLAERIIDIYQNPGKQRRMGVAGRQQLSVHFDYRLHTQRLMDFLEELNAV